MELLHDMKKWEHQFMHFEHNLMLALRKMFHNELFWVIFMVMAMLALSIVLAYVTKGDFPDRHMYLMP